MSVIEQNPAKGSIADSKASTSPAYRGGADAAP